MKILDSDIEIAEKILLPTGMRFDEERRSFIKDLNSCDLLAVPGSGKTTALQAKLCCISQHFPLEENQGVLVLSHTNNAVNEIKKKLRSDCYRLFETPHFIGTIQDFVDKFLAIPYYELCYKKKVFAIDDVAYNKEVDNYLLNYRGSSAVNYLKHRPKSFDFTHIRVHKNESGVYVFTNGMDTPIKYPVVQKWIKEGTANQKKSEIEAFILAMKSHIMHLGILSYDDCYLMAKTYIRKYPFVVKMLRKRFKYVFIDETQDLKKYQLELIDKVFYSNECSLQRIGDKNQTIFKQPDREIPEQWKERNPKTLLNSFRLTNTIAKIVNPFTIDKSPGDDGNPRFIVNGLRKIDRNIPPYLILFDKDSKDRLLPYFNQLIDIYDLRTTPEGNKYGFHIIGWNVKPKEGETIKMSLSDIFPKYTKQNEIGQPFYDTLNDFLFFGCRENTMYECYSVITKILVYVLRLLEEKDDEGRFYSKTTIKKWIKEKGEEAYANYLQFLYKSSAFLFFKEYEDCYHSVHDYLKGSFSALFNISETNFFFSNFIGERFNADFIVEQNSEYPDINIGSVHSAKGQTHCATMYVETPYKKYETEYLFRVKKHAAKKRGVIYYPNPLFQEEVTNNLVTTKSVMHMMYVGFSRPTHLLCYAVVKDNWNEDMIAKMKELGWKIKIL